MKRHTPAVWIGLSLVCLWLVFLSGSAPDGGQGKEPRRNVTHLPDKASSIQLPPAEGNCTVIYAANAEMALGGGNEDWDDPTAQVKFVPAEEGKYGIVYFGFATSAFEAGMNDQGLFFDAAATSPLEVTGSSHKISSGRYPVQEVMENSATVEEALAVFDKYNLAFMEDFQLMFGDRFGNSAILEGDEVIYKEGDYQIMTNFYQSQLPEGILPGKRYRTAEGMFEGTTDISVELFKWILDATHQEGRYPTQYSNIYDLKNRKVYVFYNHDYERVVEIDLENMLEQGRHTYELSAIFEAVRALPTPTSGPTPSLATPPPASPQPESEPSGNSNYFWLGLVPPLVVLLLILGGRVIRWGGKKAS